ncbi:gibberellin 2-beta-dioxygenase-like [Pyrus ussuriensis x Pyrus communis]|uniref:gibberellin 2beta-dioxygenase n=1 Tax=Pyrus ussuriensis x Pyrus communis TaxID=2448454 RepID=A0A5N5FEC4_9ROSA|nr:gibberellin 2-beta-dioxygenase [Pyrus x bretschneideri]KAB2601449.1 gibberellin 2-beta-dioxygenase-like [Pyrus ussuriensis x Pyrus communis]
MVVLSRPATLDRFSDLIKTCKPTSLFAGIPVVDLSSANAKHRIVRACEEHGMFKVINHGVPLDFMTTLEAQALKFFNLPQSEKDKAAPADPFGYKSKRIGPNGDVGWIEYILLSTNLDDISHKSLPIFKENPEIFRDAVEDYITAVKNMTFEVLEMVADGLGIDQRNVLSKLLKGEKSDSCFRLNYYPPCPELRALSGRSLIGFGEHTDPQIISVLKSNNTSGLQISLKDGTWVTVPPDQTAFFINVGDCLQVMTNGRFKSVKHRVLADTQSSRVSMIYFGGPPLSEKIAPLPSLMAEGEESLYKEFTWSEYKKSAYRSRLADNRLGLFEKSAAVMLSNSQF